MSIGSLTAALAGRLTITVPEAGQLLGIGRDAAYRAAERGEIPTLRLGRRIVVPVPRLLELLGALPQTESEAGPASPTIATTNAATKEPRRDQHPTNERGLRSA